MKEQSLFIGNLEVKRPIIQGGMGVGISLGNLAGAVAKAGGVGIISAAQIGYREPDFEKNAKAANLRAIKSEYKKARAIAPEGVIGFNIMVASKDYAEYVQAVIEAGADLIISGAGLPTELPKYAVGSDICLAPIVSSAKSAKVILKYWHRKYNRIPDLLVIEGPMAGGHLGFSRDELAVYAQSEYNNYADEIRAIMAVKAEYETMYGKPMPVAIAGGISDRVSADRAFALGADAVQVATRFVTTVECDADEKYKQAYIDAKKEDIVIVQSPVGMPGRAIKNEFMEHVMSGERVAPTACYACLVQCDPGKTPYCITAALIHAAKGELDQALLFCGADAYKAEKIETVEAVVSELVGM